MTTIKVTTSVRDQVNAYAAERGLTANSAIEQMLSELLWRHKVELAKRQMREASPEVWADYASEFQAWDNTASDGLEDEDW